MVRQDLVDQAYFVEYYSNISSSLNFLGSQSDYLSPNNTVSNTNLDSSTDMAIISISDGRGSGNSFQEDKALARVVVDLESNQASGVFFAQIGRGDDNTSAYTFENYDVTSNESVLTSAHLSGDSIAGLESLPNWTITKTEGGIQLSRTGGMASSFNSLINVDSYDRIAIGSNASILGTSQIAQNYVDNIAEPNYFDISLPGSASTGAITLHMTNITGLNQENENSGIANIYVDLENETTSGNFMVMRTTIPDLVAWSNVPFGERVIDNDDTTTNRQTIFHFIDEIAGVLSFDTLVLPNGEKVLRATAEAVRGNGSSQFDNFLVTMQGVWSGRSAVEITGIPSGGTFNVGSFNPNTGQYTIDPADSTIVEFIPDEHFSGIGNITLVVSYNGESHNMDIEVVRFADEPNLTLQDTAGVKDSYFDISQSIAVELVDMDGSENISMVEVGSIPVGHMIRDGSSEFVASDGNQSIDIVEWDLSQLEYFSPEGGEFDLNVVVETTDTDNFSTSNDIAQTSGQLNISIPSIEVSQEPTISISEEDSGEGYEVSLSIATQSEVVIEVLSSNTGAATIDTNQLIFTPTNWNQPQTITITPVSDEDSLDEIVSIEFSVDNDSSDSLYHNLSTIKNVNILDDDTNGISIVGADELEEGSSAQLSVNLTAQPTEDVRLNISSEDESIVRIGASQLSFGSQNWNLEQEVAIESIPRANEEDKSITLSLQVDNDNSDDGYDNLIENFTITIQNIDESALDSDSDLIPDDVEQAGPNNGDANNDGQLDYLQSNVATKMGEISQEYVSLEVSGECQNISNFEIKEEIEFVNQDEMGDYIIGLHDFELTCPLSGQSAEITMIWDGEYDTTEWVYRKYNGETYSTISDSVSYGTRLIDGQIKSTSTYSITDGGDLDNDGQSNGIIIDPAGPLIVSESDTPPNSLIRTGGE